MPKDIQSVFDREEFEQYDSRWNARLKKLKRRKAYYKGTVYRESLSALGWMRPRMEQEIKPLFLPLARAVDVDVGIIPAGWRFPQEPNPDALTGQSDPTPRVQGWIDGRDFLFRLSGWRQRGVLYVHYGAMYGTTGLKVIDDRVAGQVRVFPINPENFMLVENGQYDLSPRMAFWVEQRGSGEDGYEYAEVIEPELIRTFRDGEPYGFAGREEQYPNLLGFVPFVEKPHLEVGNSIGESTFHKATPMLDGVNEHMTDLGKVIKKHNEPQWVVFGAEDSELVKSGDNVWFMPEGSDVKPLVPDVDIAGMLEYIREAKKEVEGSLPELAFDALKAKDNIATETVELQLAELKIKVQRTRPNYDQGLADGLRMAGRAAKSLDAGDLQPIEALDDDMLMLSEDRPILPLDPITQLEVEAKKIANETARIRMEEEKRRFSLGTEEDIMRRIDGAAGGST